MATAWTPGQWEVDERNKRRVRVVCDYASIATVHALLCQGANARLIAAAPALAAAAEPLAEIVSHQMLAMVPDSEMAEVSFGELRALAAALAKARGAS